MASSKMNFTFLTVTFTTYGCRGTENYVKTEGLTTLTTKTFVFLETTPYSQCKCTDVPEDRAGSIIPY